MVGKYKDGNLQDLGTILGEVIAELKGIEAAVDEHVEEQAGAEKEIVFDFIDSLGCGDEPVYTSSEDLYENYLKWKEENKNV